MKQYTLKAKPITTGSLPETFDQELNTAQKEAVYFDKGPLLVIAGAGSGKTKTLVYRVAKLVAGGIDPKAILLLTFTRKSSQEMLRRASTVLDSRCQDVSGGTFHAFSNILLRQYASKLGYASNFTILDRADAEDIIQKIRKDLGYPKIDKRFPKKGTINSIISKSINTNK
ncbi:MAG: DNA helicase-2/ATP-dependent DNA helicase PcrA, partial [Candidatus Marinamargulisbacteria bacterium]